MIDIHFTPRERDIIYLLRKRGDTRNKTLAEILGISISVVSSHISNMRWKIKEATRSKKNISRYDLIELIREGVIDD